MVLPSEGSDEVITAMVNTTKIPIHFIKEKNSKVAYLRLGNYSSNYSAVTAGDSETFTIPDGFKSSQNPQIPIMSWTNYPSSSQTGTIFRAVIIFSGNTATIIYYDSVGTAQYRSAHGAYAPYFI